MTTRQEDTEKYRRNLGELYEVAKKADDYSRAREHCAQEFGYLRARVKSAGESGVPVERLVEVTGEHEVHIRSWIDGRIAKVHTDGRVLVDLDELRNLLYKSFEEYREEKKRQQDYSSGFESSDIMRILVTKLVEAGYDIDVRDDD